MNMPLSPGLCASLACLWEATARKAGNVHRFRDFADLRYSDFLASAAAIAPVFEHAAGRRVGQVALQAIQATRQVVAGNTNLGIVLLLAPLAAVPQSQALQQGVEEVLAGLDVDDSRNAYAAIRLARPGGMGQVAQQDLQTAPTLPLRDIMALATERDLIARQYVNGCRDVFAGVSILIEALQKWGNLEDAIIGTHLWYMAEYPDSLIARKSDLEEAEEASRRARQALDAGWPTAPRAQQAFAELDAWLTAVGNRRNPGTSADLVTACLYAALRENMIKVPLEIPWSKG
jgi:triphosphoribosyl-dephospho-CoA synthase